MKNTNTLSTGYSSVQKSDSIIRYSFVHEYDSFFMKLVKLIKFCIQKFEN